MQNNGLKSPMINSGLASFQLAIKRSTRLPLLFILFLTTLILVQSTGFDYLNLDDDVYITINPYTLKGLTWESISWAWTKFGSPYYMPVTRISFLLDVEILGVNPVGFHLVNLLIHLANIILVYLVSRFFFEQSWARFSLTILFAIHPQHLEAIIWISQRKELLAAFFGFSSLLVYLGYLNPFRSKDLHQDDAHYSMYLFALLLFVFSLLAKPTWVMFPVLLIIMDYLGAYRIGRFDIIQSVRSKTPFLGISFLYSVVHLYATSSKDGHIVNSAQALPFVDRIINSPLVLLEYFSTGLAPYSLAGYQPYPLQIISAPGSIFAALTIIGIMVLAFRYRKVQDLMLFGLCWFVISLLPVLGILGTGESIFIGDRWTYMPHAGLFISIIALLEILVVKYGIKARLLQTGLAIYIVSLVFITCTTIRHWQDSGSYWEWTLQTTNENHYAHNKLAEYYENMAFFERASYHYEKAHQLNPAEYLYVLRLGNFYSTRDVEKAFEYYEKFLTSAPPPPALVFKMGIMFLVNGHPEKAETFFYHNIEREKALPGQSVDYYLSNLYLYHLLLRSGDSDKAHTHIEAILADFSHDYDSACKFIVKELSKIETLTRYKGDRQFLHVHCPDKPS